MAPRPPTDGLDFFGFARNDTGACQGHTRRRKWLAPGRNHSQARRGITALPMPRPTGAHIPAPLRDGMVAEAIFIAMTLGALRKTSGVAEMTSWAAHWGGFSGNKPWSDNFGRTSHIALTTLDWPSQNVEGGNTVPYSGLRASTPITPMGIVCKSPGTVTMPFCGGKGEYDLFGSGRGPR